MFLSQLHKILFLFSFFFSSLFGCFFATLFSLAAFSRPTDKLTSRLTDGQVDVVFNENYIKITTKTAYHLNAEAPANVMFDNAHDGASGRATQKTASQSVFLPTVKTEKLFVFARDTEVAKKAKTATLSFYVCDDKKTVCEQHKSTVTFSPSKSDGSQSKNIKQNNYYDNAKDFNLHGDLQSDFKSANGKPTLLVFSAPWCPACIRMQTETYNKPEVKQKLKKLNFIKLNSDRIENQDLSEKFKIKAIPTMVLLDKNGKEAFRWLDFQEPQEFAKSLQTELMKVDQVASTVKKAQHGDPAAASTLAFKAFNALDYAEALKWFSLTKSAKDQKYKLATEVYLAQEKAEANEKLVENYLQTLQKAMDITPSKLDQIRWSLDFYEKKKDLKLLTEDLKLKATALVTDIDNLLKNSIITKEAFMASTHGNYSSFEKEELLWMKSRLYELLDMKDEKAKTDQETIARIAKKKLTDSKPGEILLAISYLREAGEVGKVENLYEKLIKKYPNTYVYFEKYARFMQKNKNLEKALSLADTALQFADGNVPQLNLLKSQILKDLDKKTEALVVIEETLKHENIQHKRFARTLKKINELKEEMSRKQ